MFLVQGTSVVGSTSFYATNKLLISFLMVTGGTCDYVSGVARGLKMFAHIYVVYGSNGATWNNNSAGWSVTAKTPDGKITAATWDSFSVAFEVGAEPNWNYTSVGPWNPAINASDAAGNVGVYKYAGSPFTITPAQLATSVQLTDAKTGLPIAAIASGESVNVTCNHHLSHKRRARDGLRGSSRHRSAGRLGHGRSRVGLLERHCKHLRR